MGKYDSLMTGKTTAKNKNLCNIAQTIDRISKQDKDIRLKIKGNQMILTFGVPAKERKKAERKTLRAKWLTKWLDAYGEDSEAWVDKNNGRDIVVCIHLGYNSIITSTATCSPSDTFDFDVGVAVAYARARGEKIPWYI